MIVERLRGIVMRVLNNVTEAIGNTHMLHLSKIADEFGVQGNIYAKMEYLNPGFSKRTV